MKTQVHDTDLENGIMRRGFPRPVFDTKDMQRNVQNMYQTYTYPRFLPMPYTAQTHAIALLSDERATECLTDMVCSVCGEQVELNEQGYLPVLFKNGFMTFEAGPFHEKCAKLTMTMCPHIASSYDWSIGMVSYETFCRSREFHFGGNKYDPHGFDCRPVDSNGHRV